MTRAKETASSVLSTVLRDEPWQDLGFPKRPQHGAIVQRFRADWRVQLEKALLKEMVVLLTAAHVAAGFISQSDVSAVVKLYVDGYGSGRDLWRVLGYTSRTEATQHLERSIREYVRRGRDEWSTLLGSRLDVINVPDRRLAARLIVGSIQFARTASGMVDILAARAETSDRTHPKSREPVGHGDAIRELATTVGQGLTAYIGVHNAIFRDAATFKSVLKNLGGRGVPMSKLLEDAESLLPFWKSLHERMEVFRESSYSSLSEDEKHYFDLLASYVDALSETVVALVDRQRLMNEGSKGGPKNPMTWDAFQEKERAYQNAVKQYMAIGGQLNDSAPIVFE
jgi:hypothetical protein